MDFDKIMKTLAKLPKADAHRELYEYVTGKNLDLENPCDLNEKLQWLIVYRYGENVSAFADKLAVRDYVRACGYEYILTKIYGIYETGEDALSGVQNLKEKKYILKCNHGSGPLFYSICLDADSFDVKKEVGKLAEALKSDYSLMALEYFYHYIKPYIYVEELIGENCTDYKFFCFGGVPRYVKVISERGDKDENGKQIKHQDYYDMDWNFCPFVKDDISMGGGLVCPDGFEYMKEIAAKLSEPFSMARIDLYNENGKVYFGEITLTPAFGMNRTDKQETLKMLGELTDLAYWKPEMIAFNRTDEIDSLLNMNRSENADLDPEGKSKKNAMRDISDKEKVLDKKMKELGFHLLKNPEILLKTKKEEINGICSDCCSILGSDKDDELKSVYMTILFHIAFREDISLEECWQIFWNLNRAVFVNSKLRFIDESMMEDGDISKISPAVNHIFLTKLYRIVFEFVSSNIDFSTLSFRNENERNQDLIVLVTSQFLNLGHAPTQRVLDYSYELQHNLGKKVVIINDGGMHFYRNKHLGGVAAFNFMDELNAVSVLEHKGETFEFLQAAALMPDLQVYQQLLNIIYDLNPLFVFNVGGCSLTADMCSHFVTTASMPCRVDYPISNSEYLLVARHVSQDEPEYKNLLPDQKVIETNFNYIYRPSDKIYTRTEFGIHKDAFLMTAVGYRIGEEMDEAFLALLSTCFEEYSEKRDIYLAIVGGIEESRKNEILSHMPGNAEGKIVFTGQLADASEFIKLTDLNLNPDRNGGGRSAFESLLFGIPVVTLRKGDVYYVAGDGFAADDYKKYLEIIGMYIEDGEFYEAQRRKAVERAEVLENMTETLRRILEEVTGEPYERI